VPLREVVTPWDQQPQEAAEIDWSGLGKGMQMLLMQQGGRLVDLVNPHVPWTPLNGATSALTSAGIASRFDGSASRVFQATGYADMGGVNGTFFVWMPRFGAYDSAGSIFLSTPSADLYLQITPDGRVFVTSAQAPGAPSIANSRNRSVVFSGRASKTAVMFDGVERVSNVDNRVMWPGTKTLNFGGYTGGSDWDTDADIVIAGYTSEAWTEAQARAFHDNPWRLFQRREWVPFGAGGGGGAQTLTPALFTNAGAFYSATVSQSGGAQTLTPSLYTNPNAFYPATVARGAVSLAPSLFTNSNTFYSATVSLGGSPQTLTPALFSNAQTFFSPTVGRGTVNLAPALFTNANTFYSPVITNGVTLRPSLLTNSQTFYGASITLGPATLRPALLANSNQFFAATLTGGVVRIKQKGLRKTRYTPGRVPADAKELARFIQNELERLTDGLESPFTHQLLGVLHAEPSRKPQDSVMVAFADGTDWNPGAGRGLYLHDPLTSTWTKL
jgi:hypothetical protein